MVHLVGFTIGQTLFAHQFILLVVIILSYSRNGLKYVCFQLALSCCQIAVVVLDFC